MAKIKRKFPYLPDGNVDLNHWLLEVQQNFALSETVLLAKAADISLKLTQGLTTFYGQPTLEAGLEVAEIILDLRLDQETASAAILSTAITDIKPHELMIKKELGETVAKLAFNVKQMNSLLSSEKVHTRNISQLDKMRKMLLAMATDIRVVIIKLVERLNTLRNIKGIAIEERKPIAKEVLDIYAPLANRLGMGQLKWELEDLAFYYTDPIAYKTIASFLAERRADREIRIHNFVTTLQEKLHQAEIQGEITGRAKHIYSIYLKTQRKDLNYEKIYDYSAVRILVNSIEECYTALSIVHSLWPPIIKEFDDYIAHPKPNGYRSIHTAVIDDDGKHFEIQIRTHTMHEEAERGVAAHWIYKEKKTAPINDAEKINYLRQLLDWHKEIAQDNSANEVPTSVEEHQVYVITPAGDILDFPQGSTPLDLAYHLHSELGHRCRGAKVNGQIVPLTYALRTGDKVEISAIVNGGPSRDWLNPELNYIKTSRARNKISHWFKQQALNQDIVAGRQLLEKELSKHGLAKTASLSAIARHFNFKDEDTLLVSIGRGNVRLGQVLQALQPKSNEKAPTLPVMAKPSRESKTAIAGSADLLTRFARCCKPIPGDEIIGYITQGRGISIHKKICSNITSQFNTHRLMEVDWSSSNTGVFNTDLKIVAQENDKILNDITALFANEKISLLSFNSTLNKSQNKILVLVTVQIQNSSQVQGLVHRLQQLPGILEVSRSTT